jgi:hemolysin III
MGGLMHINKSSGRDRNKRFYTLGEEIANAITHGVGAVFGIAVLVVLVVLAQRQGDAWRITAFSIYGTTLTLLYLASTLYHSIQHPKAKAVFRILDHSAIFLLIAGTYTPFLLIRLRGAWGWSLFVVVWLLAVAGIVLKAVFINRLKKISVLVYIAMGWLIVVALKPMLTRIPLPALWWLLAGGLCYTGGVAFYMMKSVRFSHAAWHLCVLAGSICHFIAILFYVLPRV